MLNKLKKNNKKGFTLVELIVVLVILAILAALLIPALTGYIDKAKEKQIIAETRQIVMAAQTLVDEEYALMDSGTGITFGQTGSTLKTDGEINVDDIATLSEVSGLTWNASTPSKADSKNVNIKMGTGVSGGSGTPVGTIATVTYAAQGMVCEYKQTTGEYLVTK